MIFLRREIGSSMQSNSGTLLILCLLSLFGIIGGNWDFAAPRASHEFMDTRLLSALGD